MALKITAHFPQIAMPSVPYSTIKLTTVQCGDEDNHVLIFQLCIKATTQLPVAVIYKDKNPRPPASKKVSDCEAN